MTLAENHRQFLSRWFCACDDARPAELAASYLDDPRLTKTFDDVAPGSAQFVHDAIVATAAEKNEHQAE